MIQTTMPMELADLVFVVTDVPRTLKALHRIRQLELPADDKRGLTLHRRRGENIFRVDELQLVGDAHLATAEAFTGLVSRVVALADTADILEPKDPARVDVVALRAPIVWTQLRAFPLSLTARHREAAHALRTGLPADLKKGEIPSDRLIRAAYDVARELRLHSSPSTETEAAAGPAVASADPLEEGLPSSDEEGA